MQNVTCCGCWQLVRKTGAKSTNGTLQCKLLGLVYGDQMFPLAEPSLMFPRILRQRRILGASESTKSDRMGVFFTTGCWAKRFPTALPPGTSCPFFDYTTHYSTIYNYSTLNYKIYSKETLLSISHCMNFVSAVPHCHPVEPMCCDVHLFDTKIQRNVYTTGM